jgi:LAO/AO transport system kinase
MAAPTELLARVQAGDPLALSRLCRRVEEGAASAALIDALHGQPRAHVVGITGSPGAGKSTLVARLITAFRKQGERVGVVAVDPTSPFTGGAVLGDRIRMQEHALDPEVFIRSLASRGLPGGLAPASEEVVLALSLWGAGVVLLETVGVGQAELEVMGLVDSVLVVLAPGMGDSVQAAKAGILEVADLLLVNKSDRPEAARTLGELEGMLALGKIITDSTWSVELLACAAEDGTGTEEVFSALLRHRAWLATAPGRQRQLGRAQQRVLRRLERTLLSAFEQEHDGLLASLSREVSSGQLTLTAATARLQSQLGPRKGDDEE